MLKIKRKKITKLSVVSNEHKFIHSIVPFNVNTKHQKYSTSVHDVKMITDSIVNIKNLVMTTNESFYLIGDKAYKTQDAFSIQNKQIKILTPDKSNSIIKLSVNENALLTKRIKIEHNIQQIKCFNRTQIRRDRKTITFMGFVFISALINNVRININLKKVKILFFIEINKNYCHLYQNK